MNRRVLIAGLLVIVPLLAFLTMGLGRDPRKVRTPMIGRTAPDFRLPAVEGDATVQLSTLRGRPVVLNFWATWCVPCYAEHKVLVEAAKSRPDVVFLGIVYQDEPDRVKSFLTQNGSAYPSLMDDGGAAAISYGVYGVPETFFIDGSGTIVAKHEGPLDDASMRTRLQVFGGRS